MLSSVASSVKQRSLGDLLFSFGADVTSKLALWNVLLERLDTNKDIDIKISVNLCKKKD